jgi:hypothetical protein
MAHNTNSSKRPELVEAIGDNGIELVPISDVVEIPVMPLGEGNIVIPATVRFDGRRGGGLPRRLISILKPGTRLNHHPRFPYVEFECTPFVRYTLPEGPVMGHRRGCYIRHIADSKDPVWDALSKADRAKLERAVKGVV